MEDSFRYLLKNAMNSKEFKNLFGEEAKINNFKKGPGGWYKESNECIAVLELQKSNYGDYYMLLMKIFIQGAFDQRYEPNKELMKRSIGHVTGNETEEFRPLFDFDQSMEDEERKVGLKKVFKDLIVPFTDSTLSIAGIKTLVERGEVHGTPAVKEELMKF